MFAAVRVAHSASSSCTHNQSADVPFLQPGPTIAEALQSIHLDEYRAAFDDAGIDAKLASTMTMDDFKSLLPTAPLGHLLRLQQLLRDLPPLARSPPVAYGKRLLAKGTQNGVLDGDLKENTVILLEFVLVTGTLLLAVSIEFLFDPTSGCSDEDACVGLRIVDAVCWTLSTWAFAVCVVTALLVAVFSVLPERHCDFAPVYAAHFPYFAFPFGCWVFGNQTLCGGLLTRALLILPEDLGVATRISLAVVLGSFNVVGLSYAAYSTKVSLDLRWSEVPLAFLGQFASFIR